MEVNAGEGQGCEVCKAVKLGYGLHLKHDSSQPQWNLEAGEDPAWIDTILITPRKSGAARPTIQASGALSLAADGCLSVNRFNRSIGVPDVGKSLNTRGSFNSFP